MNNTKKYLINKKSTYDKDYYSLYKKYKNKYLQLSKNNKLFGGAPTTTMISGPISFRYLHNFETGKNLFIFGDLHESDENICNNPDNPLVHNFIESIIRDNTDIQFDVCVEDGLYNKQIVDFENGPLTLFIKHFESLDEDKIYSNLRLHFLDIRDNSRLLKSFDPIIEKLDSLNFNLNYISDRLNSSKYQNIVLYDESKVDESIISKSISFSKTNSEIKLGEYSKDDLDASKNNNQIYNIPFNTLIASLELIYKSYLDLIKTSNFYENYQFTDNLNNLMQEDKYKFKVIYGDKKGLDISENLITLNSCSLNYDQTYDENSEDKCNPINLSIDDVLIKAIIKIIKSTNKLSKIYRDTNFESRSSINLVEIDNYLEKRVRNIFESDILRSSVYKFTNIISNLEENLSKTFYLLKDYKKEINGSSIHIEYDIERIPNNILLEAYQVLLNEAFTKKLFFSLFEINTLVSNFQNLIREIKVITMDIYSILRISKKYFNNTILYLGNLHSTNIAKYFYSYGNYKLLFEMSNEINIKEINRYVSAQPTRCINVGNSFVPSNFKLGPYEEYSLPTEDEMLPLSKGKTIFKNNLKKNYDKAEKMIIKFNSIISQLKKNSKNLIERDKNLVFYLIDRIKFFPNEYKRVNKIFLYITKYIILIENLSLRDGETDLTLNHISQFVVINKDQLEA